MDGDVAPIQKICDIAEEYNALTYIDEVHAVGLYGNRKSGQAEEQGCDDRISIYEGTLGKAFGVGGGYIAGSKAFVDWTRSSSSSFIFTTSMSPAIVAAALKSIDVVQSSEGLRLQQAQQVAAQSLKTQLMDRGIPVLNNSTHIVPVMVGDPIRCQHISDRLLETHNIYCQPIQYPTVSKGTERLRFAPGPWHTSEHISQCVDAVEECFRIFGGKINGRS